MVLSTLQHAVGRWPIRYKLLALAMLTSAASLLILSAAFVFYQGSIARASVTRELGTAADVIGRNSVAALRFGDCKTVREMLAALRARPDIVRAEIELDAEPLLRIEPGCDIRPFARYPDRPHAGAAAAAGPDLIVVARRIEDGSDTIGHITLWANLDQLAQQQHAFLGVVLMAAIGAVLAGLALSARLQSLISRPLRHLAAVMEQVSRNKDFAVRAEPTTADELGTVIDGFNGMLSEIEGQHRELEGYRTRLEQQVAERTAALSLSNRQLQQTIDALRLTNQQAEAASRAKSDFLANISHELRTPLNAIIGFSDMMRAEILGPLENKTYRDYANDIHFSGAHLLDIINDILDIVRLEAGKAQFNEEAVSIEEVVRETIRLSAPLAEKGGVRILWAGAGVLLPDLRCDRVRLREMLLNLLSNAVKFTPPGGRVEIAAELSDGLSLVVADTGIGIKPEDIPRVLTPFGQVASVYSRRHQGTGLGLTLTKAMVEQHGGTLSLTSVPEAGTTVRLNFPAGRIVPRARCDQAAPGLAAG